MTSILDKDRADVSLEKQNKINRMGIHINVKPLPFQHKRISVIFRWIKIFLDRSRAHPSEEIEYRSCFIIRSAGPCSAERLLSYNCSGRFIIDIKISGCIF